MPTFNKIILIGFVGNDPQIKPINDTTKVANLSMAVTENGYTTGSGQVVPERTMWVNLVAWRGLANIAEKYVKKGSNIMIEGKLRIYSYEDKDGNKKDRTEIELSDIQLLDKK